MKAVKIQNDKYKKIQIYLRFRAITFHHLKVCSSCVLSSALLLRVHNPNEQDPRGCKNFLLLRDPYLKNSCLLQQGMLAFFVHNAAGKGLLTAARP